MLVVRRHVLRSDFEEFRRFLDGLAVKDSYGQFDVAVWVREFQRV